MVNEQQYQDPYSTLNELNTRIRILEGRYNLTRERLLIVNQNMIDHYKKLSSDMKSLKEDIVAIKDSVNSLKETVKDIVKELHLLARKDEIKVLEKYINLWNPLDMMTKKEVEELIEKSRKNVRSKK